MVKLIYVIARKPGMSPDDFHRYWRDTHGPIAARIPGVRRYVQCHSMDAIRFGADAPPYEGAAELWFDDEPAMREALRSPEARAALEDERNFIDHARVFALVTEEHVVVGGQDR